MQVNGGVERWTRSAKLLRAKDLPNVDIKWFDQLEIHVGNGEIYAFSSGRKDLSHLRELRSRRYVRCQRGNDSTPPSHNSAEASLRGRASRALKGAKAVRPRPLAFRPPSFELSAELEWLLQRALGPLSWAPATPVAGQESVEVALKLELAARIYARHPRERLEQELGPQATQRLREQYIGTVARGALLDHALDQLLGHAEVSAVPCIVLKHAALSRMGALRAGSRAASDLDVLVPQALAREFQEALKRNGYRDLGLRESAHQLPALQDPSGVLIEVHLHIPGVTLGPGRPFAHADDLIAAGFARRSGNALLPDPAVVTAHALAHGLAQHARAPHMYSSLKAFADLADLHDAVGGDYERASPFLSSTMSGEELASAFALARALQKGDLEAAMRGGPGILLRHALAAQLDHAYAARLRLRMLTRPGPAPLHFDSARVLMMLRSAWGITRAWFAQRRGRA